MSNVIVFHKAADKVKSALGGKVGGCAAEILTAVYIHSTVTCGGLVNFRQIHQGATSGNSEYTDGVAERLAHYVKELEELELVSVDNTGEPLVSIRNVAVDVLLSGIIDDRRNWDSAR